MYLSNKAKEQIFKDNGKSEKDSGSTEGQVALLTTRINHLTKHLKDNKKDFNTERSLLKMVHHMRLITLLHVMASIQFVD